MKVYKNFDEVQEVLLKHNMADDAVMISRVGLPDEQVFVGLDNMPKDSKLNLNPTDLTIWKLYSKKIKTNTKK